MNDNVCHAKSSPREALTWTTVAFFGGFAGVSAFGPIIPTLKQHMAMSPLLMGLLAASPALTGSLLRIPFGAMVDRTGGRKPVLILLSMAVLGVAGITLMFRLFPSPTPVHVPFFLLFGILSGCGIATFSVGIPAVSYWYPQKAQGSALAIYAGLGNLAPGLFAMVLPAMVVWLGFTVSYVVWLGFLIVLTALVFTYMQDAPYFQYREMGIDIDPDALLLACGEELLPSGKAMQSIRKAGSDWRTWILTYFYFITFGGFIALTVWFPTYWSESFGMGLVQAGMLTAIYSLSASLLRVVGGYAADRIGGENVTLLAFVIVAIGAVSMVLSTRSLIPAVAGTLLLALGMGFANAAVFKLVPTFMPAAVGGAAGIVGGFGAFGGFVIPPVMGMFVKWGGPAGYSRGFSVFLVLSILAIAFVILLTHQARAAERGGKHHER